jgi:hypothetical protein
MDKKSRARHGRKFQEDKRRGSHSVGCIYCTWHYVVCPLRHKVLMATRESNSRLQEGRRTSLENSQNHGQERLFAGILSFLAHGFLAGILFATSPNCAFVDLRAPSTSHTLHPFATHFINQTADFRNTRSTYQVFTDPARKTPQPPSSLFLIEILNRILFHLLGYLFK